MDINLVVEDDSYEHQPPSMEGNSFEHHVPFMNGDSSWPQPCDHITHKQSHMHMLDHLSISDEDKTLTSKEHGFKDQWKL